MKVIIESRDQRVRAVLQETSEGVVVEFYERDARDRSVSNGKFVYRDILDCPFHKALDEITDLVNKMMPVVTYHVAHEGPCDASCSGHFDN